MTMITGKQGNTGDEPYGYAQQNSEQEKTKKSSKFSFLKSDSSKSESAKTSTAKASSTKNIQKVPLTEKEFSANVKMAQMHYAKANEYEASAIESGRKVEELNKKLAENQAKREQLQETVKVVTEAEAKLARIQAIKDRANQARTNTK